MSQFISIFCRLLADREKLKIALLILLAFCILSVSLTFFALSTVKPYMGTLLTRTEQGWIVESVDVNGSANAAGIKEGDRPIEINSQPAPEFLGKYENVGVVLGMLIKELIVIDDHGKLKSVTLQSISPSWRSQIEQITLFLVCLAYWITGFYVFLKRPKNVAAFLLCLSGLVFGLAISAITAAERAVPTALQLEIIASVIGPWLLLHFFLILPEERSGLRKNPLLFIIYLPAVIILVLFPLIGYADGQTLPDFRSIRLFEYSVGFIAAAGVAAFNYLHAISPRTRQQMKIVFFSCIAALIPFLLFSTLPDVIWGKATLPAGFSILFIALIPLGMGYAVITRKLLDIDFVIRRGIVYSLITIVMAAFLSGAIFTVLVFQEVLSVPEEIVIALLLGGIATALFGPTKRGAENLLDRFIYKDRYDYREIIQSLSIALNSVKDSTDVSRLVVGTIVQTLNLAGGCLFIKNQSGSFEISATQGIFTNRVKQKKLLSLISRRDHDINFPNSASSADPNLAFLVPLITVDKEVGVLCLSQKVSRQDFSSGDIYLLQGVISVASATLRSAMLIRDVSVRDTFVSIASHELRTPMTAIMGYTELLLQRNPPNTTRKQWLKRIYKNSQKLTDIIDDLLNVTRIQSGKINMKLEKVRLQDILEESLTFTRESSDKHDIFVEIDPNLPAVIIDREKFGQVIGNLLSNAIKYSPEGGRIILAAHEDMENSRVVVSISDEGIGIGPEDKDLLFTTFHRIQRPETKSIRGSGLGLYIVKEWVEEMGGNIWLESKLNEGSTFFIAIPVSK
jgi:signal transduction histidine kinase